jgi:hypothetical protein
MLACLMVLSFALVLSYGVQSYMARKEDRLSLTLDAKLDLARSSTDSRLSTRSGSGSGRSRGSSWGSSDSCMVEKAE